MPTYQYACTECDDRLEVVQSFSDDPLTECPACSGRLRKVFSAVGVVFKGSGFYRTDSRKGGGEKKEAVAAEKTSGTDKGGASSPGTASPGTASPDRTTPAKAGSGGPPAKAASSSTSGASSAA